MKHSMEYPPAHRLGWSSSCSHEPSELPHWDYQRVTMINKTSWLWTRKIHQFSHLFSLFLLHWETYSWFSFIFPHKSWSCWSFQELLYISFHSWLNGSVEQRHKRGVHLYLGLGADFTTAPLYDSHESIWTPTCWVENCGHRGFFMPLPFILGQKTCDSSRLYDLWYIYIYVCYVNQCVSVHWSRSLAIFLGLNSSQYQIHRWFLFKLDGSHLPSFATNHHLIGE
jgi:hypothetical protein